MDGVHGPFLVAGLCELAADWWKSGLAILFPMLTGMSWKCDKVIQGHHRAKALSYASRQHDSVARLVLL